MSSFLTGDEARRSVDTYLGIGDNIYTTQEIIDSGAIPRLKGYGVKPGKVSDSIFGGKGSYVDKSTGETIEFENPPLQTKDDLPLRIMVRTQRISTHDITRGEIPFKDQILAENHNYMRRMLSSAIGTSQLEVNGLPDNSAVIGAENLTQIPFENVLRAYMAKSSTSTSLYQHFIKGEREFCGHRLPDNLIPNGVLPYVMDTPSTKSDEHDESVSEAQLYKLGVCTPQQYAQIRNSSLFAFGMISQFLRDKGLIAVDTKTEHGVNKSGEIVSQDEIWTMDSSRFWLADDYESQLTKLQSGEITELNPRSYSKEFARGFSKGDKGYTDEQRAQIAVRYIEGVQHLLGKRFEPDMRSNKERVVSGIESIVQQLVA
jgi:phosphoribosylaminoimidazole-succinocarboxamide synthase